MKYLQRERETIDMPECQAVSCHGCRLGGGDGNGIELLLQCNGEINLNNSQKKMKNVHNTNPVHVARSSARKRRKQMRR